MSRKAPTTGKRELRERARQAVYSLISVNVSNWPECDLAVGFDDEDDLDMGVLEDEFQRIQQRIWP